MKESFLLALLFVPTTVMVHLPASSEPSSNTQTYQVAGLVDDLKNAVKEKSKSKPQTTPQAAEEQRNGKASAQTEPAAPTPVGNAASTAQSAAAVNASATAKSNTAQRPDRNAGRQPSETVEACRQRFAGQADAKSKAAKKAALACSPSGGAGKGTGYGI